MRTSTLEEKFNEFHEKNPEVFKIFRHYAVKMRNTGRRHYSARTIFHRIRWHNDISTDSADGFKINDHHSPFYARLLEETDPSFIGFFRHRKG